MTTTSPINLTIARKVLHASSPTEKCRLALSASTDISDGDEAPDTIPDRPARPDKPVLVDPIQVPRRKLSTLEGRVALLHAVAHIELNAIDLAFDMAARFSSNDDFSPEAAIAFAKDWITVGQDEARHFQLIEDRLKALGSYYGALPAHDGLWQIAEETSDDVLARLALAPMVLEARGLDVTPGMIQRLESVRDYESADCLKIIYNEEIAHVAAGVKWFDHVCRIRGVDPEVTFQDLVRRRFKGQLKKPFNSGAREEAGLLERFYEPLSG